jgi:hypothetical protein
MQLGLLTGTDPAPPPEVIDIPADKDRNVPAKMKINPDYASWISRDQIVLSYLLQFLHPKVFQSGLPSTRCFLPKVRPKSTIFLFPSLIQRSCRCQPLNIFQDAKFC